MKISQIVEKEDKNDAIVLHREGIFYRAYEVSAYRFVSDVKDYLPKVRYYKNIRKNVAFIGAVRSIFRLI